MNNSTPNSDLTNTQRVWQPIGTLQEEHVKAMSELQTALTNGDYQAQKLAGDKIAYIEARMPELAQAAREYARRKALARTQAQA